MGSTIKASDADACATRSFEVQQLAGRVAACADRVDALLARFRQVQLLEWKSPAGTAYRTTVALQAAALGRARERLHLAAMAVFRHAQGVAQSETRGSGGVY